MGRNNDSRARNTRWLAVVTVATMVAAMVLVNATTAQAQAPALSNSRVAPGDTVTVSGNGCISTDPLSYYVVVRLTNPNSATEVTGEVAANSSGDWSAQITVPSSLGEGDYGIASACEGRNGVSVVYTSNYDPVTLAVTAPAPTPEPEPTAEPTAEILATPTPTETAEPTNTPTPAPTATAALSEPTVELSPSGGRAPFTTTLSGTACVDPDDEDTEVEIRISNDDRTRAATASVDSNGDWSKSLSFGAEDVGNNTVRASCVTADNTIFKYSSRTVTVGSPTLSKAEGSLSAEQTKINVGDTVKAKATECPSDSADDPDDFQVRFKLTYQGTDEPWTETEKGSPDGKGTHTASIEVKKGAPVGTYLLTANCEEKQSDGSYIAVEEYTNVTVTVFAGSTTPTPTSTPTNKTTPTAIPTPTPDDINIGFTG